MKRSLFNLHCTAIGSILAVVAGCASPDRLLGPKVYWRLNDRLGARYGTNTSATQPISDQLDRYFDARDGKAGVANDVVSRTRLRDDIVYGLMAVDDYNFQSYASSGAFLNRATNTVGDITVLGLTSTAAFVNGPQAKSALAAMAAIVTGSRIAFEKDVLYDSTLPVLVDRMQKLRIAKRDAIAAKLDAHDDDKISLPALFPDLYDYFRDGTLAAALADIAKDPQPTPKDNPAPAATAPAKSPTDTTPQPAKSAATKPVP